MGKRPAASVIARWTISPRQPSMSDRTRAFGASGPIVETADLARVFQDLHQKGDGILDLAPALPCPANTSPVSPTAIAGRRSR